MLLRFMLIFIGLWLCVQRAISEEIAESVTVGAVLALTGQAAHLGESNRRGIELALDLYNQDSRSEQLAVRLVVEDSRSEPTFGVAGFKRLVDRFNTPLVFVNLTSVVMPIREIAEQSKVVVLAESTHPLLTQSAPYVFRRFFTGAEGLKAFHQFVKQKGFRRGAVLHAEEQWGESVAQAVEDLSNENQFEVVSREAFSRDQTDMRMLLLRIMQNEPDLLYIVGIGPALSSSYRMREELGITVPTVGFVVCGQSVVMDQVKTALRGTYSLEPRFDQEGESFRLLRAGFQKKYPGEKLDQSVVVGFDSMRFALDSLKAGARTGDEIREFLLNTPKLPGAFGPATFDQEGDAPVEVETVEIGEGGCPSL